MLTGGAGTPADGRTHNLADAALTHPWCDARHERCRPLLGVDPSERVCQASVRRSVLVLREDIS